VKIINRKRKGVGFCTVYTMKQEIKIVKHDPELLSHAICHEMVWMFYPHT
jgi:hypothetical protein